MDAVQSRTEESLAKLMKQRTILNVRKKRRQHLYTALADAEALAPSKALYEEGLTGMEAEFEKYMEAVKQLEKCGISAERLTEEKAEIYEQLASLNREIRAERRKLKLCQEIRQQIPDMEQDIQMCIRDRACAAGLRRRGAGVAGWHQQPADAGWYPAKWQPL